MDWDKESQMLRKPYPAQLGMPRSTAIHVANKAWGWSRLNIQRSLEINWNLLMAIANIVCTFHR